MLLRFCIVLFSFFRFFSFFFRFVLHMLRQFAHTRLHAIFFSALRLSTIAHVFNLHVFSKLLKTERRVFGTRGQLYRLTTLHAKPDSR